MCHSHSGLSSAMWSQLLSFPSGFGRRVVVFVPVDLHLVVTVSIVSSGSSALRLLTMVFLFVDNTPALGRGFLTHAVMKSFGGWKSGERAVLPRYVMVLALSIASASGMSWKIFRIRSLVMWSSITSDILMPKMFRIALCQNTLSLSICD